MLPVSLVTASHFCHKKLGKTTHIAVREARIRLDSPISYSDLHPRRNTCIPDLENPSSEKKLRFGKDKNCDYISFVAAFQCPLPLRGGQTRDYQKTSSFMPS